jgi:hypothetical protein
MEVPVRKLVSVILVLTVLVLSSGCAGLSAQQQRALTGGVLGAAGGAALGAIAGSAAIGAAVGGGAGIIGGLIVHEVVK